MSMHLRPLHDRDSILFAKYAGQEVNVDDVLAIQERSL